MMISSERDYFSKGLAIPGYDISRSTIYWRFRAEEFKTPYDNWYMALPVSEHGFRVAPIDEVRNRAL